MIAQIMIGSDYDTHTYVWQCSEHVSIQYRTQKSEHDGEVGMSLDYSCLGNV